ncbi:carboxypeptidase S [Fomitiporia mediterranea MF3/22]|uniref:carboxypeptidase S n=1 Tax=Fomitiporia mediterranea (strain MF3/22) TaxID=694068 RepID=UPI0004408D04|nr:carboxypeptidase S [Fomitiporia mediterranea MF3/22]EJD07406.1 carboxypeptidase S [Fomitiporia mediterranea MF3/22]
MSSAEGGQHGSGGQPHSRIPENVPSTRKTWERIAFLCVGLAGIFVGLHAIQLYEDISQDSFGIDPPQDLCPQPDELLPEKNRAIWDTFSERLGTEEFKSKAADWLGGAVRIPTEAFDDMGPVDDDPRWEKFAPFHEYLERTFPLIHSNLKRTKGKDVLNTYGLIYEWDGSDPSLKPLLLAAHQDVVPVDPTTVGEWVHPPFSGLYDSERIWGRGSVDDKNGLIGIMMTIETLLSINFRPSRKIVLTFGFDEEASGLFGAHELNKHLEATFGHDSFAMLVDEGDGFSEQHGALFAIPAIAEKGYMDTWIEVSTPGGLSSAPPTHTGIGMLAALLVTYEANPMKVHIDRSSPVYGMMQCMAAHAPSMDSKLRNAIIKSTKSDRALRALEKLVEDYPELCSSISTTQAIDLVQGGVKVNALPEQAWAVINHRIATQSSSHAVKHRDTNVIIELVKKFDLTLNAFGETFFNGSSGSVALSTMWDYALEPAPVTPTDAAPYRLLSGTIRSTYASHRSYSNRDEIKIAPGIISGNTDTCSYWNLTRHIFRYNHQDMRLENKVPGGIHTVNESFAIDNFLEMIRFFMTLILNADEYEL